VEVNNYSETSGSAAKGAPLTVAIFATDLDAQAHAADLRRLNHHVRVRTASRTIRFDCIESVVHVVTMRRTV
jgi:hypothetical protein